MKRRSTQGRTIATATCTQSMSSVLVDQALLCMCKTACDTRLLCQSIRFVSFATEEAPGSDHKGMGLW